MCVVYRSLFPIGLQITSTTAADMEIQLYWVYPLSGLVTFTICAEYRGPCVNDSSLDRKVIISTIAEQIEYNTRISGLEKFSEYHVTIHSAPSSLSTPSPPSALEMTSSTTVHTLGAGIG